MRKLTNVGMFAMLVFILGSAGCARKSSQTTGDSAAVQGKWQSTPGQPGATLELKGNNLEFHTANGQEWYQGTFTLQEDVSPKRMTVTIKDCPMPKYVGKTANAIYEVNNGTLTIAAFEPGNPNTPATFTDQGVSRLSFKMQ